MTPAVSWALILMGLVVLYAIASEVVLWRGDVDPIETDTDTKD